ncbi:hypothetical protein EK904_013570, partial [Melospiza melodia maxima]
MVRELMQVVLARKPKMCSFLEWRDLKVVYKRYRKTPKKKWRKKKWGSVSKKLKKLRKKWERVGKNGGLRAMSPCPAGFWPWGHLHLHVGFWWPWARPHLPVSPRYASLYFCCAIEGQDNELITLELIHRYVELLDKYFGSVSGDTMGTPRGHLGDTMGTPRGHQKHLRNIRDMPGSSGTPRGHLGDIPGSSGTPETSQGDPRVTRNILRTSGPPQGHPG